MSGFVYMMTNKPDGIIYTGVAADLGVRVTQHMQGAGSDFCRRYGLDRLVWYEHFDRIEDAIDQEKRLKKWRRQWKIDLIEKANPKWETLAAPSSP